MKVTEEILPNEAVLSDASDSANASLRFRVAIKRYWHWAAAVLLAVVLWVPRLGGPIDVRWDAGVYYVLGTSLASGQGYRILSEPGSPEALQYPPLLPAMVALYERALGSTDPAVVGPWLRLSYAALFLGYALAVMALARKYLRPIFALMATVLCLLHPSSIFLSDLLFADLPFALVSVVFALVVVRGDAAWPQRPWQRELLSFALATAGFFLRTAGVVLFAAWMIEALALRRWRLALVRGALVLLPVVLWQAHVERVRRSDEYRHPAYEYQRAPYQFYNVSYADNVLLNDPARPELGRATTRTLTVRLMKNFPHLAKAIGEGISASDFYWRESISHLQNRLFGHTDIPLRVFLVPIVCLLGIVVAGLVILARRSAWLIVFYIIGSMALICTTPWRFQFQRYVAPVAPFLAIAAVVAFSTITAALRAPRPIRMAAVVGRVALAGLLTLTFAVQVYAAWEIFQQRERGGASFVPSRGAVGPHFFYYDQLWRGWEQAIAWIEAHSLPDAIVATPYSHLCYLRTGRHAVSPPVESDPARVRHLLDTVPVSYVIVDYGYSLPAIENDVQDWRLVQSFDGTRLYQRNARVQ
jgi:hypothetical protein